MLFQGLGEREIDDVLDELSQSGCLPRRVIACGTNPLLGALHACWKGAADLTVVLVEPAAGDVSDALDLILECEQVDQGSLVRVSGRARAGPGRSGSGRVLIDDLADAASIVNACRPLLALATHRDFDPCRSGGSHAPTPQAYY